MSGLPNYSEGQNGSARDVADSKQRPPGYGEATGSEDPISGETYAEKFSVAAQSVRDEEQLARHFTIHATGNNNFVLLADGKPKYLVDNSSSLAKVFVRQGNSTSGKIISTGSIVRPFVKEVVTTYTSRKSGTSQTTIEGSGKFSIVWSFTIQKRAYKWKSSKGVWTCSCGDKVVATYDTGASINVEESATGINDVLISTAFAIDHFDRMSSERRRRALNAVTGQSMSGPGALLGGSILGR